MIEELVITRFGCLTNASFDFKQVTVFVGHNESGKTTIFDALVQAVCTPSEATSQGRELKRRYGDRRARRASVKPPIEQHPDVVEFLNVFAVRSGTVALEITGRNWIDRFRNTLFTGGLNPMSIAEELRREASRTTKRAKESEDERCSAQNEFDARQAERRAILERRDATEAAELRLASLKGENETLQKEIAEGELRVAVQQQHKERRRVAELLDAAGRLRSAQREISDLEPFMQDRSADISAARRAIDEADSKAAKLKAERGAAEAAATELEQEAEAAAETAKQEEVLGRSLRDLVAWLRQTPSVESVTRTVWSGPLLATGGVLAVIGLVAAGLTFAKLVGIVAGTVEVGVALALALTSIVLARRQIAVEDRTKRVEYVASRQRQIEELLGMGTAGMDLEILHSEIFARLVRSDAAVEQARTTRGKADHTRRRLEDITREAGTADTEASLARDAQVRLFTAIGVSGEADLAAQRERYAGQVRTRDLLANKLQPALTEFGVSSFDALEPILVARIAEIDEAIDAPETSPEELRRLEAELTQNRNRLAQQTAEERELAERLSGERGELRGSLDRLPEAIETQEERVATLTAQRDETHLQARAEELAAELFQEIAEDTAGTVKALAAQAAERLTIVLQTPGRTVDLGKLEDATTFSSIDVTGEARGYEQLSRGTQDALLFAVRLVLAEKLAEDPRLLLLDEPFGALDEIRTDGLLKLLDDLRVRCGFQLVFFTKARALVEATQRAFGDARVHDLDVAAR